MHRILLRSTLVILALATFAAAADARRVRVVHRHHRTKVVVHRGFPLHRALPHVHVRPARVAVRVAPRVYLAPVVFGATVVALPGDDVRVWNGREELERDEEWTELNMNVDRRGSRLVFEVAEGPAQISFAEVVFENGDTQVVDFDDKVHAPGLYALLDFKDGRKVDHVRLVAKAEGDESEIALHLIS